MAEIDVNAYATTAANAAATTPSVIETQQPGATGALRQVMTIGDPTTRANMQKITAAGEATVIGGTSTAGTVGASTTFTAADIVVAAPDGTGTLVTGTPTAGSMTTAFAVTDGLVASTFLIKGLTASQTVITIYFEASTNSTNGTDGDWIEVKQRRTGTQVGVESADYKTQANGYFRGNCAGFKWLRARLLGTFSGTPSAQIFTSAGQGATFLNSGLPGGNSNIGKVAIDQTTNIIAGTTIQNAAVAVGNGTNLNVQGYVTAIISLTGTMGSNTAVAFEVSTDDVTFVPIAGHQIGLAGNLTTTTTNIGDFRFNVAAYKSIRARISVFGTGSVTAKGFVSALPGHSTTVNANIIAALPVGTNTIGNVKVTDGTNTAAVKAASTAAAASDPSVVVNISPNTPPIPATAYTQVWNGSAFEAVLGAAARGMDVSLKLPIPAGTNTIGNVTQNDTQSATLAIAANAVTGAQLTGLNGVGTATLQLTGTWVATLNFQTTVDGTNWVSILDNASVKSAGTNVTGGSVGTNGIYQINLAGAVGVRVITIAYTSGTINGLIRTTIADSMIALNTPLPAGTAVIGSLSNNQSVNNTQLNSVAMLAGNGVTGTGSQRVTIASDNTAFSVNANIAAAQTLATVTTVGAVTAITNALPTGANTIGAVNIAAAQTLATVTTVSAVTAITNAVNIGTKTTGGQTSHTLISAATTNATSVKATAGTVYGIQVSNTGAAVAFLKLFNLAVAPTVGTSVAVKTLIIPVGGGIVVPINDVGLAFGTGISYSVTGLATTADATAVALAQVVVNIDFA